MARALRHAPETAGFREEAESIADELAEFEPTKCLCGKPVFADKRCPVCKESVLDALRRTAKGAANGQ